MKASVFITFFTAATAVIAGNTRGSANSAKIRCINSCIDNLKDVFDDYEELVRHCNNLCA